MFSTKVISGLWDYTIYVEQTTNDFKNARINAIKDNRKLALVNVISKLIDISDFKIVDKLIDSDSAYFFEEKLRLLNENTINNIYKVDITYYFNKNKILAFLNKNGIPYITNINNKNLFIPIIDDSFANNTKWYKMFNSINTDDYLTKVILLNNNNINKEKILQKDANYLLELKNKYDVDDIIFASLCTIYPSKDMENDSNSELNNDNDNVNPEVYYSLNVISFNNNKHQNFDNLNSLYEALKYVVGFAEINVKSRIIYSQDLKNTKTFKVVYNSFIDWVAIYNYLKQIPQVDNLYLSELNEHYCIIKIKYHGLLDDIVKVALNRNIIIDTAELTISCKGFCY